MGCDIHEHVEYFRGDKWVRASDKKGPKCTFCCGTGLREGSKCYFCRGIGTKWYIPRNYMLFGVLAGVRWYEAEHIEPRGLPEDISESTKSNKSKFYEGDGHSASYFSLNELQDLKDKKQVITGYVDLRQYIEFKEKGRPSYWTDYYYNRMKLISNEEMDRRVKLMPFWDGERLYTEIIWEMTNQQIGNGFWEVFVAAMEKLHKDPEKVRFVFWFDN